MTGHHDTSAVGSALVATLFAIVLIAGLAFAMMSSSMASKQEYEGRQEWQQRFYLAEAGIAHALTDIRSGGTGDVSPVGYGPGDYQVVTVDNGDQTYTITSTGIVGGASRTVQAVVREAQGVFHHAMFAGNSSGDPTYVLPLGGANPDHDVVVGDIFSAQDITLTGDAQVTGSLRAGGTITGGSGDEGVSQPLPEIASMNYETNHDVNVAADFAAQGIYRSNALGGDAWELPEAMPAHIFRLNPTDRAAENLSTTKDDYFLEDPYEVFSPSAALNSASATQITITDGDATPDEPLERVYYIDGNLWMHNKNSFSFAMDAGNDKARITFVVKGNIYFADNFLNRDAASEGVAFIAIKDQNEPDSGNIYFGDPLFGTLEQMDGFMYAENNFLDQNLPAAGSATVTVNGIMSAGNQIAIDRELNGARSRLVLNFDDRIKRGAVRLPGIPTPANTTIRIPFTMVSFREVTSGP